VLKRLHDPLIYYPLNYYYIQAVEISNLGKFWLLFGLALKFFVASVFLFEAVNSDFLFHTALNLFCQFQFQLPQTVNQKHNSEVANNSEPSTATAQIPLK
jgi:multidrug efflux pump subunit AcrB